MPELSLNNIDQIARDISREEITFSHLMNELIDHVCCDVENEMQKGLSFHEAYALVRKKLGPRRLKEIQEETLYLVDTKYRNMKKLMMISGVAGTVLLGFAALFKIQHWPLAGVMLTLGAVLLAFVFLPSALVVTWKESHSSKRIFLYVSAFISGMFFILGVLFKIQHWPAAAIFLAIAVLSGIFLLVPALLSKLLSMNGDSRFRTVYISAASGIIFYAAGMLFKIQHWPAASVLIMLGIIVLCCVAMPLYVWMKWKDENHIRGEFLFIILGILSIIVPGALVNLNLQNSYDRGYYRHLDQQQAVFEMGKANVQNLVSSVSDTAELKVVTQLDARTREVLAVIDDAAKKMVQEAEGKPGMPANDPQQLKVTATGLTISYKDLSFPFNPYHARNNLMPGVATRASIENALAAYAAYLNGLIGVSGQTDFSEILNPALFLPVDQGHPAGISLLSALHSLEVLKNSLLTIEYSAIKTIMAKPAI
jgi:hypothetical protein